MRRGKIRSEVKVFSNSRARIVLDGKSDDEQDRFGFKRGSIHNVIHYYDLE